MSNDSKDITLRPTQGLQIQSVDELARVAKMMAESGFFQDSRDAAQAGVKIMAGQAWGIDPFSSMTGIHVIKGRPSIGAGLMSSQVKASGKYDYRVRRLDNEACVIEFFQAGESIGVSEFTIQDARKAGTQNLDKFARNMLFARAMSNGVKWYCPDVFTTPVYVPEELGAQVDGEGNVIDVQSRPTQAPVERQIDAAPAVKAEPSPAPVPSKVGAPIPEDDEPVDVDALAEQDEEQGGMFEQPEEGVTPAQLRAIHTRLTKLGFNGTKEEKERARQFIGWFIGREIASSKDLTKAEAHTLMDTSDSDLGLKLDDFNAEQQMAAEGGAA